MNYTSTSKIDDGPWSPLDLAVITCSGEKKDKKHTNCKSNRHNQTHLWTTQSKIQEVEEMEI